MDLLEEGEQWEALKAWFRENGLAIIGGALLGTLALLGWRWWQSRTETQHLAANVAYETLLGKFTETDPDGAVKALEQFRKDYADSAYAAPAELAAARILVSRNELDKAVGYLRSVADTSKDLQLRTVARLRLARVQIAQGKADEALATLGTGDAGAFASVFAEVRGDALLAKGDKAGALREYQAARQTREPGGDAPGADGANLLDLKINDLASEAASPAAVPPVATGKTTP